ncbi:MAG: ankyrin repeat domain-containing protein [Planctomycetaceae bacterium]|nr:ankyrin repeat domain-containing protein [Planctomycetaceae bacterium]
MQRDFLILALGIVVCLQAPGCSRSSSTPSTASTARVGRWTQEAERGWAPELFFDDPAVLRLCEAIRKKDYAEIDRLVKTEGVDINATGRMNVTPLFWALPLGFAEALDKIPRDAKGMPIGSEAVPVQEEYLGKHARLLEHLLKLKANPNIKTTPIILARLLREHKHITVPGGAFDFVEGLSVTHLAALAYYQSEISFLPIVLANGGDPNLVGTDGKTPVLLACGAGFGWIHSGAPSAENVALMIEAGADFEIRDSGGNTPILVAAHHGHSRVVFMLLHAGADFRVKNDSGRGLAAYTRQLHKSIDVILTKGGETRCFPV